MLKIPAIKLVDARMSTQHFGTAVRWLRTPVLIFVVDVRLGLQWSDARLAANGVLRCH